MKPRAKALIWLIAVFFIGAGLGSIATVSLGRSGVLTAWWNEPRPQDARRRPSGEGSFTERLIRELNLDKTQESQVREILEESRQRLKELYRTRRHQHDEIRKQAIDEIRSLLSPPQEEKLDALLTQLSQNRRERSNRRNGTEDKK